MYRDSSSSSQSQTYQNLGQKKKALNQIKYINPIARLQYEEKQQQIYTKYTKFTKQSVVKKIKAINKIAEFQQEEQNQNVGYDQLLEYKYGKEKSEPFFFEDNEKHEYQFCDLCDCIHDDHVEVHRTACERKRAEDPEIYSPYSEVYGEESLKRIQKSAQRLTSTEAEQFKKILSNILSTKSKNNPRKQQILSWLQSLQNLKRSSKDESIFIKIISKTKRLINKIFQ